MVIVWHDTRSFFVMIFELTRNCVIFDKKNIS